MDSCFNNINSPFVLKVHYDGDHLTLLNVIKGYEQVKGDKTWCTDNFIKARSMKQVLVR